VPSKLYVFPSSSTLLPLPSSFPLSLSYSPQVLAKDSQGLIKTSKLTKGCTPLHLAAQRGFHEAIKPLLDAGVDLSATDTTLGWSALVCPRPYLPFSLSLSISFSFSLSLSLSLLPVPSFSSC
jgi:ankyrin repeat protein